LVLLDLSLLFIVAQINVGRAADRLEVLCGELGESREVPFSLVILEGCEKTRM